MLVVAATTLAGCAAPVRPTSTPATRQDDLVRARLGQTVTVNGPKVTPLQVIEDSRCPATVVCVWAGRIRISVRIDLGSSSQVREMQQGQPIHVADGTLELVEVAPVRGATSVPVKPIEQTFGFRFMGGF